MSFKKWYCFQNPLVSCQDIWIIFAARFPLHNRADWNQWYYIKEECKSIWSQDIDWKKWADDPMLNPRPLSKISSKWYHNYSTLHSAKPLKINIWTESLLWCPMLHPMLRQKHITTNITCACCQQYTKDSVFWLA